MGNTYREQCNRFLIFVQKSTSFVVFLNSFLVRDFTRSYYELQLDVLPSACAASEAVHAHRWSKTNYCNEAVQRESGPVHKQCTIEDEPLKLVSGAVHRRSTIEDEPLQRSSEAVYRRSTIKDEPLLQWGSRVVHRRLTIEDEPLQRGSGAVHRRSTFANIQIPVIQRCCSERVNMLEYQNVGLDHSLGRVTSSVLKSGEWINS